MRKTIDALLLLSLVLFPGLFGAAKNSSAADHYIRPALANDAAHGCADNGDGSTWECNTGSGVGALTAPPSGNEWTRGDIYYFSDGWYGSLSVTTPASAEQYITILKATANAHGAAAGWAATLGDGQARIQLATSPGAGVSVPTSYVLFDGAVGSGNDKNSYGFYIMPPADMCANSNVHGFRTNNSGAATLINHVTLAHTAIEGCGDIGIDLTAPKCSRGVYIGGRQTLDSQNNHIIVRNNWFYNTETQVLMTNCPTCEIRGNYFASNFSNSLTCHGQQISTNNADNLIIKNNIFAHSKTYVLGTHISACTAFDTGNATGLTEGVLTDASKSRGVNTINNEYNYLKVAQGVYRRILSNTADTVTVGPATMLADGNTTGAAYTLYVCWRASDNVQAFNNIVIGDGPVIRNFSGFCSADSNYADALTRLKVYHNTFYDTNFFSYGAVYAGAQSDPVTNKAQVYNNLFVDTVGPRMENAGCSFPADCSVGSAIDNRYNAFYNTTGSYDGGEEGTAQDTTGAPFVDSAAGNYHLKQATSAGLILSSPYNYDRDGIQRGTDGKWDRGAYEYVSRPAAPGGLTVK